MRQAASKDSASIGRSRRPARSTVVLAALLRLLALFVSTELAGVVHTALDVTDTLSGAEHPHDDCDAEAGHECPPGCVNCHCTHGAVAWAAPRVASVPRLEAVHPSGNETGFVPLADLPPAGPDLPALYRPPRAIALS